MLALEETVYQVDTAESGTKGVELQKKNFYNLIFLDLKMPGLNGVETLQEIRKLDKIEGKPYYRLIRPFITEEGCLKCHSDQGYKVGDIRGGISLSVPMKPYLASAQRRIVHVAIGLGVLWFIGVGGLWIGMGNIRNRIKEREAVEKERNGYVEDLQEALEQVKQLGGLLPICAHCKNIRDDKGYWNKIESYIHQHSEAEFSHSICPECAKKFYPDLDIYDD